MPSAVASDRPADIRASLRLDRGAFRLEVQLELPGRGVSALWGPSGSGKSTSLRLLAGLERGRGEVHVLGACWQDDARGVFLPVHRRRVGYVFQDAALMPWATVRRR